jgi:hypothetical protein
MLQMLRPGVTNTRVLQDLTKAYLLVDPSLLNGFMKAVFSRTSVYEFDAVIGTVCFLR